MHRIHYAKYSPGESLLPVPQPASSLLIWFVLISGPMWKHEGKKHTYNVKATQCWERNVGNTKERFLFFFPFGSRVVKSEEAGELYTEKACLLQICGFFCLHFLFLTKKREEIKNLPPSTGTVRRQIHDRLVNIIRQRVKYMLALVVGEVTHLVKGSFLYRF